MSSLCVDKRCKPFHLKSYCITSVIIVIPPPGLWPGRGLQGDDPSLRIRVPAGCAPRLYSQPAQARLWEHSGHPGRGRDLLAQSILPCARRSLGEPHTCSAYLYEHPIEMLPSQCAVPDTAFALHSHVSVCIHLCLLCADSLISSIPIRYLIVFPRHDPLPSFPPHGLLRSIMGSSRAVASLTSVQRKTNAVAKNLE